MVLLGQYLDFDKLDCVLYSNLYLEEEKFVIKTPIAQEHDTEFHDDIKVEKFDLKDRAFLTSF